MKKRQMRRNAGLVLFIAGFSHIGQLWIYGISGHILAAAALGLCYIMIGLGLLGQSKTSLWLGSFLPALGIIGALARYNDYESDVIVIVHLAINIVVALVCLWLLFDTYGWLRNSDERDQP